MNNYAVETRRRSRNLLVVEGKHEKDELFWLIFKCFPEMNIDIDDVWIYGTNIYKLYEDIVKEYGNDWAKEEMDIDLPFVISKKEHLETTHYRNDFTNRKQFEQMDLSEILNVQNEVSRNFEKGFIWVLSTCVLLIPDYNFKLIK